MRGSLLQGIVLMAVTTIRTQKMRSGLTILGIVIGITAIVGMTWLIRGFDESLRDSIREIGPETLFVAQFSGLSLMSGADFNELLKRPTLTPADARAIEPQAESIAQVMITIGEDGSTRSRAYDEGERTKLLSIVGTTHDYPDVYHVTLEHGRDPRRHGGDVHPPRTASRRAERLRRHDPGTWPFGCGIRSTAQRSSPWSPSRPSRCSSAAAA